MINRGSSPTISPDDLMPRRNPSLVSRIAGLFFRAQPNVGPQPVDREGTSTGLQTQSLGTMFDKQFKIDFARRAVYLEVDEMDNASEEASIALDIIANNVCTSEDGEQMSFVVHSDDDHVQEIFDKAVQVCKLHQKILPMVRNVVKYGDGFSEPVVNAAAEIVDLKQLPPITMFRNENLTGGFKMVPPKYVGGKCVNNSKECAFEQRVDETGDLVAAFYPWQVIHIRLNHDGFSPYGKSHLRVARSTYRKLKAIEESLIIGRLTREYLKLIFYIDTTGLSKTEKRTALKEFKDNITQRIAVDGRAENPFSVMTDFFISTGWIKIGSQVQPSQAKVDVLDPKNVGIHEITDVEYLHRKFIATLRVPPAHLGFEKDVNAKATLTLQDTQFIRFLRSVQQQVGQALEQYFDLVLILAGYDPEVTDYTITWPELSATDQMNAAQSELWRAQRDQLDIMNGVIDAEWAQIHRIEMTPDEMTAVQERVKQKKEEEQALLEKQAQQQADIQNQQGDVEHQRSLELVTAKAQVGGFNKKKATAASNGHK